MILSPVEPPDSALVGAEAAESLSGSLDPHDSISQAPESSHGYGPSLSSFLESFSAFFGFGSGPPCTSFKDMVSKLVAEQVQVQLATNSPSLAECSVPSAHGLAEASTNSPSDLGAQLDAEASQADVSGGSSRGHEPSIARGEVVQAPSLLDTSPSTGKRSRPLKDAPWKVKRSRPEVGGILAAAPCPGFLTGRDRDMALRTAPSTLACLSPGPG